MKETLTRLFSEGSFARSVAILTGGTVAGQALAILALPLLTRLYTPQNFELLAVYTALIGIVTTISCLRYNIAIPLPESDRDGMALLAASLLPAFILAAALLLPVLFAPHWAAAILGQQDFVPHLWMVPAGVLFASVYNALQYWASRKRRFGIVTRTRITRAAGGVGAQLAIGSVAPSPFGLIFGQLLYNFLGIIGLARNLWREDRAILAGLSWKHTRQKAIMFRRFPIWSVPEALFNTAGSQLPIILLAAFVAGPEAGFVFLATRVMGLPMALLGSSVSQVFLAEAPDRLRDGNLAKFTHRTMWAGLKIGALPLTAAAIMAPTLFPLIFGPEWSRAGWLVVWMAPWFVLQFVASPVSMVFHVLGFQSAAMTLQAVGFAIRVGFVLVALNIGTPFVAEIYAVSGAVFYAIYLLTIAYITSAKCRFQS